IEPFVSMNTQNPGQIAVSSQSGIRVTSDDGNFSTAQIFPNKTSVGDTATTYDGAGRLFWTNLTSAGITIVQINPATGAVISGTTFTVDNPAGNEDDKDFITADPNTNNLYVIWTQFSFETRVLLTRSTDHGAHWSTPIRVDSEFDGFTWPASVTVAPDGHVFAAYHSITDFD